MTTFQWLLVLGFPAEVAATVAMPDVFATAGSVTANDRALAPEHRASPVLASVIAPDRRYIGPL